MTPNEVGMHIEEMAAISRLFTQQTVSSGVALRKLIEDNQNDGVSGLGENLTAAEKALQQRQIVDRVTTLREAMYDQSMAYQTGLDPVVDRDTACTVELVLGAELPALAICVQLASSDLNKVRDANANLAEIARADSGFAQSLRESSIFAASQQTLMRRISAGLPGGQDQVVPDNADTLETVCEQWDRLLTIGEVTQVPMHTVISKIGRPLEEAFKYLEYNPAPAVDGRDPAATLAHPSDFKMDKLYVVGTPLHSPAKIGDFIQPINDDKNVYIFSDENSAQKKADETAPGYVPPNIRDKFSRFFRLCCEMLIRSSLNHQGSPLFRMMTMLVPFSPEDVDRMRGLGVQGRDDPLGRGDWGGGAEQNVLFLDYCAAQLMHDAWPEQDLIRTFMTDIRRLFAMRGRARQSRRPLLAAYVAELGQPGQVVVNPRAFTQGDKTRNYLACRRFIKLVVLALNSPPTPAEPEFSWFGFSNAAPAILSALLSSSIHERTQMALGVTPAPRAFGRIPNQPIGHAAQTAQQQQANNRGGANLAQANMNAARNMAGANNELFGVLAWLASNAELLARGIFQMPTGQLVADFLTGGAVVKLKVTATIAVLFSIVNFGMNAAFTAVVVAVTGPIFWQRVAITLMYGATVEAGRFAFGAAVLAEIGWVMYVGYLVYHARNRAVPRRLGAWWQAIRDSIGF
jgi:hypothetical protein